jgi:hypothetical protein
MKRFILLPLILIASALIVAVGTVTALVILVSCIGPAYWRLTRKLFERC